MPEMDSMTPALELLNVSYAIDEKSLLLKDISLQVQAGETLVLLGRSGSGKTTLLKLINGLRQATQGEIRVLGKSVAHWDTIRLRRQIGYVIQEGGLFPHYTVKENVALLPRLEGWPVARIDQRVAELLTLVGLPLAEYGARYPHQLSGGQRQRVGVARALAIDPPLLLLDEPFGALDPITRRQLQQEFSRIQAKLRKTVLFITHDIREALQLATQIALLSAGELITISKPEDFLTATHPEVKAFTECLVDEIRSRK